MGLASEATEGRDAKVLGRGGGVNPDLFQVHIRNKRNSHNLTLSTSVTTCPSVLSLIHPNYEGLEHRKPVPASGPLHLLSLGLGSFFVQLSARLT